MESEEAYRFWHLMANRGAELAGAKQDGALLDEALTYEAFALHFLTDQFAGGHRRVDRPALKDFAARKQHNAD